MICSKSPQGISYAIKQNSEDVAFCSLSVRCGTRAEEDLPEGTAHFLEHCLFKGTKKRSARCINSCLDRLGGELNAYTTKEEIVLHATVLRQDLHTAVDLLLDIACNASFPEDEIEIEKGVVLDEIISYKDSPAEDIYDCFESYFFEGHPLGRLTLGNRSSIGKSTREDLVSFYKKNFIPQNMALSIVCKSDEKAVEKSLLKLCSKYFGRLEQIQAPQEKELAPVESRHFSLRMDKGNHECNIILGTQAPSLYEEEDRLCAVLLSNIIGGPAGNSCLNSILREKHGWVYAAECSYVQYSDCGIMAISLGCDKENLGRCLKETGKILDRLKSKALSERSLKAGKRQLLGQLSISACTGETQCLSMGKSLLAFGRVIPDSESIEKLNKISPEQLRSLCCRLWDESRISELIYI